MKTDEVFFLPEADAVGSPDARVTLFASATATTPKAVLSLQGFIAECRGETHKGAVLAIRQAAAAGDKTKAGLLKRKLPAVTLSCSMTSRAKGAPERVRTHSGWLQCDFDAQDNPGVVQDEIRARLQADQHVGAVFVGPSGAGIKAALRIDGSRHRESFGSAARYFKSEYGLTIDAACKDVERLCFLSHDPEAWCRIVGKSEVLPITDEPALITVAKPPPTLSTGGGHTTSHSPASAAKIAHILSFIPPRPKYPEWLEIISAVSSELPPAEAEAVLAAWSPEESEGEYAAKIRSGLTKFSLGTLIYYAKEGGYEPAPRAVITLGSSKRPPAAAVAAVAVPDDGEPAVADETTFFYALDDSLPDDVGSQYDGEPEPPKMNYYTSPRTKLRYPLIKGRPGVRLPAVNNPLSAFAWQLADLLYEKPLFTRSGFCVKLDTEKRGMVLFKDQVLRTFIEETTTPHIVAVKEDKKGVKTVTLLPHTANAEQARGVLACNRFLRGLRPLSRVLPCRLPIMRKDGRIELPGAGYDAETRTWIMNDPEASYDSTPTPLPAAVAFFEDLLGEFPFAEDGGRSKAVAIAAILSVYCTALIPTDATKPAFLYVANSEGSGKTTLAKLAALTAQSGDAPVEAAPTSEEEWAKKLLGIVISGRRVVLLDNLKGLLSSAALEAYCTSPTFAGRVLGRNDEFVGEAGATILITGNGLQTSPDLRRRTLMCELFSPLLRPEDRVYKKSLDPVRIKELRPQILAACWSLVAAWDDAGRPGSSMTSASFQRWADVVAGIVEHAGWACPLAAPQVTTAGDVDASDIATLPDVLDLGDMRSFASLAELCEGAGLFEAVTSDKDFGGQSLTPAARSAFGRLLKRFDGRVVGPGIRFVIEGAGRNRVYGLRQA